MEMDLTKKFLGDDFVECLWIKIIVNNKHRMNTSSKNIKWFFMCSFMRNAYCYGCDAFKIKQMPYKVEDRPCIGIWTNKWFYLCYSKNLYFFIIHFQRIIHLQSTQMHLNSFGATVYLILMCSVLMLLSYCITNSIKCVASQNKVGLIHAYLKEPLKQKLWPHVTSRHKESQDRSKESSTVNGDVCNCINIILAPISA